MSHYRDNMAANMRQTVQLPLPGPVVDLGGRGHRAWMKDIIGSDFETWDMQPGRDVSRTVDAMKMKDVPDASVGTIVSTSTFEHIEKPWTAAAQMARVTKPGGLLYVCAPFQFAFHEQPRDYWRFSPDALRVLFEQNYDEIACSWVSELASFYYGRRKGAGDEETAIKTALSIPGLIVEEELRFLYRTACTAPRGGEFVELGAFKGRSCSILCHVAGQQGQLPWSIDDYSYMVHSSPEVVTKNLHGFGLAAHVLKADSRTVPLGIGAVACLFIDSQHIAAQITAEYAAWAPKIIKGGIVICHDYQGTKWTEMKAAIDGLFGDGWKRLGTQKSMIAFRRVS